MTTNNELASYWADKYEAEQQADYETAQLQAKLGKLMCNGV